jgi:GNAT superfamily N-acetyltransferase
VPGFEIRRATAKDLELLVEHRHMMFEEMASPTADELSVHDESYRSWARELMKRRLLHGYVVESNSGKPAASGCVWLREMQPSPGHPHGMVPYVLSMYTRPEFRRKGLASMIIEEAMEWARKRGCYKIMLHASSTGRKVYSQLGWKRTWEMEFRYDTPAKPARLRRGRSRLPSKPSQAAR